MKKLVPLLLVAVLLITAVSGASLAYFTDTEISALNTVTSGNIQIIQYEQQRVKDNNGNYTTGLEPFEQNQVLMPMVQSDAPNTEFVEFTVDGHNVHLRNESFKNYIDKIVTVQNVGSNPAYVRTIIAVPTAGDIKWLHIDTNTNSEDWSWGEVVPATINGVQYDLHTATYKKVLPSGTDTNSIRITSPSLLGFYVDSHVDFDGTNYYLGSATLGDLSKFEILVCTQAVQTTSFSAVDEALTSTFQPITADNNPWANKQTHYIKNNDDFQTLLNSNEISSGDTIRLADGEYNLPTGIPAAVRIVGQSSDVVVTVPSAVQGIAIELHNLTVANDFNFIGSAEFDQVHFNGSFTASFNKLSYVVDCRFKTTPVLEPDNAANQLLVIFENCTDADGNAIPRN